MPFYLILEIIAFLSALIWCRQKGNSFIAFIPFLFYTVVNECVASYYSKVLDANNYFLYTIYVPVSFIFYTVLLKNELTNRKIKAIFYIVAVFCILFAIINAFFFQGWAAFNSYTITVISIATISFCLLFLFDFLEKTASSSNPIKEPIFWIVAGLLFFYFGGLVLNILYKYSLEQDFKINGNKMYSFIINFLNFLLYGCLTIAFRLCYKKRKSIS